MVGIARLEVHLLEESSIGNGPVDSVRTIPDSKEPLPETKPNIAGAIE